MRALERQLGQSRYMAACMAVILDAALILMLSCFAPFHVRMAMLNETTIEGPSPEFHVGMRRNWRQVMGSDPLLWFVPVYGGGPEGDGVHWPSPLVKSCASTAARGAMGSSASKQQPQPQQPQQQQQRSAQALEEGRLLAGQHEQSDSSADEEE